MKANPGGQLAPDQIVGRDPLITDMWSILEGRSIYMNDLRRIGKTQIMVKMHAEPPEGWLVVKQDLGGTHSAADFATAACRMSAKVLGTRKQGLRVMGNWLKAAGGLEIGGFLKLPDGAPAPWKEVLRQTFADIEESMTGLGPGQRMVFFWDEVPYLLDNIQKREGPAVAMEVLDALRALGQDHDRIRLVLTGSIGVHHVLGGLKKEGYNGSPFNRMDHVQPGPLDPSDSIELALALIEGNGIDCADLKACALAAAESVGHVPFYLHRLVSRLPKSGATTPASIAELLDQQITSRNNDWDLQHYCDRLKPYYGDQAALALCVLDAIAIAGELTFQTLRKRVNAKLPTEDESLRALLGLLEMDHYLKRTPKQGYRFYLNLIHRWWCLSRSLT